MTTPSDPESTHQSGPQSVSDDVPAAGKGSASAGMATTAPMPVVDRARSLDELAAAVMARPVDRGMPARRTSRAVPYTPPPPAPAPVVPSPPRLVVAPPIVEEPVDEEPLVEEPLVEEALVEAPVVDAPVAEEAAAEEPVVEKAVAPAPVTEPVQVPAAQAPDASTPGDAVSDANVSPVQSTDVGESAEPVRQWRPATDESAEEPLPVALMQVHTPVQAEPAPTEPVGPPIVVEPPTQAIVIADPPAEASAETTVETTAETTTETTTTPGRRTEQTAKLAYASLAAPVHYGRPRWEEPTDPMDPPEPYPSRGDDEPGSRQDRRRAKKAAKAPKRSQLHDRRRTAGRRPLFGLVALVILTFGGAFFGWVSADPFWLSVGRGSQGTVTVTDCMSRGVGQTCIGNYKSPGYTARDITIAGLPPSQQKGVQPARMLSAKHAWAYTTSNRGLQMRWGIGAFFALLLGFLAASGTGAKYLRPFGRRRVFAARVLAFAGPVLAFFALIFAALI
ncbi:hypothetical protein [Fodinicola feengrottensis]|uniref:hypothetical protein n=1 Tax=Fodinicola feengrottensis TaxID=435914 RepID=UPI0031E34417